MTSAEAEARLLYAQALVTSTIARLMHGNLVLELAEARGELEPWEVCTCSEYPNPAWHDSSCPRDRADCAGFWFACRLQHNCEGCDSLRDRCRSCKPPAIKCCPDCSHWQTESEAYP